MRITARYVYVDEIWLCELESAFTMAQLAPKLIPIIVFRLFVAPTILQPEM